ncbi:MULTISPECIES: lipoate--protein ligase family protein [Halolamina]|uniref:Lipoate-protein ligase A n=1 Tax=Halolamina pelagica TaxID=699431 RepID=A0A1I5UEF4_9EURY|nr:MULTISPECIES: lipoate--protein ligase family protein [Halolamina]NHX37241.1 lipoate--protein ligase family protein [Halolamina sp. R1-12]SFP93397.1 Lipoate-protein ligase A [Halolamina pelagica]
MRVIRGRASTPEGDRERTRDLLDSVADTGTPVVRAWTPHRHLAFGRRDANEPGYDDARAAASEQGFPPVERSVGGRAVAYTGTTVAFAALEPTDDSRTGITDRYEAGVDTVVDALESLGVDAERGEPPDAFCPGDYSVQAPCSTDEQRRRPGKLAGIAQRVTAGAAMVSGVVVVADRAEIRDVLAPVYDALDVPFDPDSVGSVTAAGGPSDPERVARALEAAIVDGRERSVESLRAATDTSREA